jgi:hypothetical protein
VPCKTNVKSEIEAGVAAAMESIVAALTRPLTAEEKSPKRQLTKTPRIAFAGSYEEVNRFFYSRGWEKPRLKKSPSTRSWRAPSPRTCRS